MKRFTSSARFSLLLLLVLDPARPYVSAFCSQAFAGSAHSVQTVSRRFRFDPKVLLCSQLGDDEDDDGDSDDDEIMDKGASLGDWRQFRASLIRGERKETDQTIPNENAPPDISEPSVAAANEALLAQQNPALAQEYRSGAWAHTVAGPEVGGLLMRLPLEAELYLGKKKQNYWKKHLDILLQLTDTAKVQRDLNDSVQQQMDEDPDKKRLFETSLWFKVAEHMIAQKLQAITTSSKVKNGVLDPSDLEEDSDRVLLNKYIHYRKTWQETCLLLSHNDETGRSESVILNRPLAKSVNRQMASLLVEGQNNNNSNRFGRDFPDMVVQAFGAEAAVYMGGPHRRQEPALLLHGITDLPGAIELAPGTGLYLGGFEAAVAGVRDGTYQPLDFKFFLGRQEYNPEVGALLPKIQERAYQPLACARSLVLKQCLGLPKPLWHEVLELCGGELKAISTIEMRKRVDLEQQ